MELIAVDFPGLDPSGLRRACLHEHQRSSRAFGDQQVKNRFYRHKRHSRCEPLLAFRSCPVAPITLPDLEFLAGVWHCPICLAVLGKSTRGAFCVGLQVEATRRWIARPLHPRQRALVRHKGVPLGQKINFPVTLYSRLRIRALLVKDKRGIPSGSNIGGVS